MELVKYRLRFLYKQERLENAYTMGGEGPLLYYNLEPILHKPTLKIEEVTSYIRCSPKTTSSKVVEYPLSLLKEW